MLQCHEAVHNIHGEIQKDGLNFVHLYFLKYVCYVNDLHNIWRMKKEIISFQMPPLECSPSVNRAAASVESKMATMQHKIFCVREFIKTEPATAVQRVFRLRFNIQTPTGKSICRSNHQFEQMGCLYKGKSSGRPRVSEENVRRIQESWA